jgi:hypothetical protein
MLNTVKDIRRRIIDALDSDDGVSLKVYEALLLLGDGLPDYGTPIFDCVKASDWAFYLNEDDACDLRELYDL